MFVGHGLIALAVVGLAARRYGLAPERALTLGVVAALFATVPDVDVAYAPVGMLFAAGDAGFLDAFWDASSVTHRTVTHSLLVAIPAAAGFAAFPRRRAVGAALLGGLVALVAALSGPLAGTIALLFVGAGALVALLAALVGFGTRTTLAAALAGLLTHPFGDLFTGGPPAFLYPLDVVLVPTRVAPFGDPTLDLFLAFGVEVAAIWAGVGAVALLADLRLREHLRPRGAVGTAFAGSILVLPNPTVDAAYGFVFGVLTTGAVGGLRRRDGVGAWIVTGLSAVTVAGTAYALAYVA